MLKFSGHLYNVRIQNSRLIMWQINKLNKVTWFFASYQISKYIIQLISDNQWLIITSGMISDLLQVRSRSENYENSYSQVKTINFIKSIEICAKFVAAAIFQIKNPCSIDIYGWDYTAFHITLYFKENRKIRKYTASYFLPHLIKIFFIYRKSCSNTGNSNPDLLNSAR